MYRKRPSLPPTPERSLLLKIKRAFSPGGAVRPDLPREERKRGVK
jgi:hypothetical protein